MLYFDLLAPILPVLVKDLAPVGIDPERVDLSYANQVSPEVSGIALDPLRSP